MDSSVLSRRKRRRSRNFNIIEKEVLCKLILPFNDIIRSKSADKESKELRRRTWNEIFQNFQRIMNYRSERTLDQIKIYWKNQLSKNKTQIRNKKARPLSSNNFMSQALANFNNSYQKYGSFKGSNNNCDTMVSHPPCKYQNFSNRPSEIRNSIDAVVQGVSNSNESLGADYRRIIEMLMDVNRTIDFYNLKLAQA
ncbi:hypothetical protein RF11_03678 [Thelohanellus kitauei]|uniref:Myb/SANT-like DNA-binding domain-containing protein n=1 Tax=Thelohanellus kitauei TaxID=669202 RepID=A0A0C2N171_THEKT|nr:hypothetical protein RF11_03678 [Thelohanellus kitauei]